MIIDGAHDDLAVNALAAAIASDPRLIGVPHHFVIGMSSGHDPAPFLATLSTLSTSITATRAQHPRAEPTGAIAGGDRTIVCIDDVAAAIEHARGLARVDGGVVIVTGSLFVVGEARGLFTSMPRDNARPAY